MDRMNEHKAVPSGPLPKEAHLDTNDKSTAIITFQEGTAVKLQAKRPNYTTSATIDNIANATNTPLSGFQVADGDGAMHNATATITGNILRIHSDEVKRVSQIQYLMAKQSQLFKHRIQRLKLAFESVHPQCESIIGLIPSCYIGQCKGYSGIHA